MKKEYGFVQGVSRAASKCTLPLWESTLQAEKIAQNSTEGTGGRDTWWAMPTSQHPELTVDCLRRGIKGQSCSPEVNQKQQLVG